MNAESIGKLSFWLNILFMFSSLISLLVRKFIVISCGGALSQAYMKCLLLAGSDNNICHYLRFRYCCFKISKLSSINDTILWSNWNLNLKNLDGSKWSFSAANSACSVWILFNILKAVVEPCRPHRSLAYLLTPPRHTFPRRPKPRATLNSPAS